MNRIEQIMEEKGMPSLKAIAAVFELPPNRIYSVAKQPKEGEVYSAKVYNWDAIERFIVRRLSLDYTPNTLEEVVELALEEDEKFKEIDGRRASTRGSNYGKKIEVDGKMVPVRRFSNHEMVNADGEVTNPLVVLKKDPLVYKIVMQTRSHTVLVPVSNLEGEVASDLVRVVSNSTLNGKGFAATGTAQGIESRFSGEYLEKYPQYAPDYKEPETSEAEE